MITDDDVKKLKVAFKDTFATKDDLKSMEDRQNKRFATKDDLKDLRSQINDDIDGKLVKQKEEIVESVGEYIADAIVPVLDKQDKRITRIEKKLNLAPIAD